MKKIIIGLFILSAICVGTAAFTSPAIAQKEVSTVGVDENHINAKTAEDCMECHGTYAENAENTADLGLWNPHNSIHGGYVDCMNCHTYNKITRNYCAYCHDYLPDMQK